MGDFGEKFRKGREAKNLSYDDVSNVTKISSRMLQAIEEENFDLLPGGVFNKGFIRAYAKHLGLDGEEAVTDYLVALRQAQVDAHEVWEPVTPKPAAAQRPVATESRPLAPYRKPTLKTAPLPPTEELPELQLPRAEDVRPPRNKFLNDRGPAHPWKLPAAAALVILLAVIFWTRHSRTTHTQSTNTSSTSTLAAQSGTASPQISSAASQSSPNPSPSTKQPPNSQPAPTPQTTPQVHAPALANPPAPAPEKSSAKLSDPQKPEGTKQKQQPATGAEPDVIVRTFPPTKAAPAATPSAPMTLTIRASETSWISVTADGQLASQETLIAPAHTSIRATRQIVARVGNAAGVTFLWNGQEFSAQGAEAEVKTFLFDASGMRVIP